MVNFKREHLRAPLRTSVLYDSDGYILKARLQNISKGGILLENLPHYPKKKEFNFLIDMICYPNFSRLNTSQINRMKTIEFERNIVIATGKIVRTFEIESEVDKLFVNHIGVAFSHLRGKSDALIENYVDSYAKNIIYLLTLLESSQSDENIRFYGQRW